MKRSFILIIVFLLTGCELVQLMDSANTHVVLEEVLAGQKIAVLDFEKYGYDIPTKYSAILSDKFAELLYLNAGCKILERSFIDKQLNEVELYDNKFWRFLEENKVNFLLVGDIRQITTSQLFEPLKEKEVELSVRIINISTKDVDGVGKTKFIFTNNMLAEATYALEKILTETGKVRWIMR